MCCCCFCCSSSLSHSYKRQFLANLETLDFPFIVGCYLIKLLAEETISDARIPNFRSSDYDNLSFNLAILFNYQLSPSVKQTLNVNDGEESFFVSLEQFIESQKCIIYQFTESFSSSLRVCKFPQLYISQVIITTVPPWSWDNKDTTGDRFAITQTIKIQSMGRN